MVNQKRFLAVLQSEGVEFFTGVPDSFLNGFCNYLLAHLPDDRHVIAANEGNAVAIASGYYFSTGTVPLVYMQNSGMGNMYNPLVSLADSHVYSVPMILLIGWRGKPGTERKHPQHRTQGETTLKLLDMLGIPYIVAEHDDEKLEGQTRRAVRTAKLKKMPFAIIGEKGVFAESGKANLVDARYPLSREEAIEVVLDAMPEDTFYAVTTGRATREMYFLRERRGEKHGHDFLNLGSMGHASSVALGMALADRDRKVVCLDGDSAALMHMGSFTMVSKVDVPNMMHIVLNNGAHESVGGQPSAGYLVDFTAIAEGSGYSTVGKAVTTGEDLTDAVSVLSGRGRASFIDVRIHKGLRGELPPLDISAGGLIQELMENLKGRR